MIFATPIKGSHMWRNPVTNQEFPIQGVNPNSQLIAIHPDDRVEVMDAPTSMGARSLKNQLDSEQYAKMTEGLNPEDAAQQYAKFIMEEFLK